MKIIGFILLFLTASFAFTLLLANDDSWKYYLAIIIVILALDFWCRCFKRIRKFAVCPRCNSSNISIEKHVEGRYFAQCKDPNCGESSGCCDTEPEATKLWSTKYE